MKLGKDKERSWFEWYCEQLKNGVLKNKEEGYLFTCPCCGYPNLEERGSYEICDICGWEDDGQDSHNKDTVLGGPNKDYSLSEARLNFDKYLTQYRPSDVSMFDSERVRIRVLLVKKNISELDCYRWMGRVKVDKKLSSILKKMKIL
jgi:hypothetical protein